MKSDRLKRPAHPKSGLVPWSRGKHNDWAYHRGLELREDDGLLTHARARAFLENVAKRRIPITYQELAKALQI